MICVHERIPDRILPLNEMNWHPIVNQTTTQFELAFKTVLEILFHVFYCRIYLASFVSHDMRIV